MNYRENRQFELNKKILINILILIITLYFVFHSIYGKRGIIAYFKLQKELEQSNNQLELSRAKRLEIENKTKLLRPDSLDKDMLDETVRDVLGFSSPKEKIYIKDN